MRVNIAGAFTDAWGLWKRDRALLVPVAGLFLFLPTLALLLLIPDPPARIGADAGRAAILAWLDKYFEWFGTNGPAFVIANLMALFGTLVVLLLYLDSGRPDLRASLGGAVTLFPRFLLAAILAAVPVWIGLLLFIVPGLYVMGRLMMIGPAIVAERPLAASRSLARSLALTRGHGLLLMAIAAIGVFANQVGAAPFLALADMMKGAGAENPVAESLLCIGAALVSTAVVLGMLLVRVAIYRRLVAAKSGI